MESSNTSHLDSNTNEEFRIGEWQFNHFPQLSDLLVQSTNIRKGDTSILFRGLHVKDSRVDLSWQYPHDSERGHIQGYTSSWLEIIMVQTGSASDNVARSTGCLHNESFVVQTLQDVANNLTDRLQRTQIILRLLIARMQTFDVVAHAF
jgi:hypothetical protein